MCKIFYFFENLFMLLNKFIVSLLIQLYVEAYKILLFRNKKRNIFKYSIISKHTNKNTGDSLHSGNNMKFTTFDNNNIALFYCFFILFYCFSTMACGAGNWWGRNCGLQNINGGDCVN